MDLPTLIDKGSRFARNPVDWWRWRRRWPRFFARLQVEAERNKEFDRRFGVDTAEELPLEAAGIDPKDRDRGNSLYRGMWEPVFHDIMRILDLDFERFTFVDYGSGKGKALLLASSYPFKRIIGVEYAPVLHEIAARNIGVYQADRQKCKRIEAVCADATTFDPPADPLICFFFNPFDLDTARRVFEKLRASFHRDPREIYIIYVNMRHIRENQAEFANVEWMVLIKKELHFVIYRITR
jgi:hypothetical protein